MPLAISCPNCQTSLRVASEHAGKVVRCSHCQQPFTAMAAPPPMPDRPATGSGAAPAPDLETDLLRALRGDAAAAHNAFDRRSSLANILSRSQMPAWKSLLRLDPEGALTPSILRLTWLCGCALAAAALFYGVWTFLNVIKELPLKYLFDPIAIFIACVVGVVFLLLNLRLWLELCLNIHRRSAP